MNDIHQELQHSLSMKLLDTATARIEALEADLQACLAQLEENTVIMNAAHARIEALEAALREIARGEGPYSPGRYEHIKGLQEIARAALEKEAGK